jgi:predicted nucleic acid-binding protein
MIVVFDTDVLIPMILPASRSARLFARLEAAGHKVAISEPILDEVREKLLEDADVRDWLELPEQDLLAYVADLPKLCVLTSGSVVVAGVVKDDPDDDKILACAQESGASYIVSEDRHLRKLKEWEGIKIMNRTEFMAELDRLGVP